MKKIILSFLFALVPFTFVSAELNLDNALVCLHSAWYTCEDWNCWKIEGEIDSFNVMIANYSTYTAQVFRCWWNCSPFDYSYNSSEVFWSYYRDGAMIKYNVLDNSFAEVVTLWTSIIYYSGMCYNYNDIVQ